MSDNWFIFEMIFKYLKKIGNKSNNKVSSVY